VAVVIWLAVFLFALITEQSAGHVATVRRYRSERLGDLPSRIVLLIAHEPTMLRCKPTRDCGADRLAGRKLAMPFHAVLRQPKCLALANGTPDAAVARGAVAMPRPSRMPAPP